MTTLDNGILNFLTVLAHVRRMFRQIHILAEKTKLFRRVTTTVNPFTTANAEGYADQGTTIQLSLEAELLEPPSPDRKAFGASLLLRHNCDVWVLEAEIGWSGQEVGWDPVDSKDVTEATIEAMMQKIPELGDWVCCRFRKEVGKLTK